MKVYLDTIRFAPWFLVIYLAVFFVTVYFQSPEAWVFLVSPLIGVFIALILPFAWRQKNEWIWWLVGFFPIMFFVQKFGLVGLQLVLLSLSITACIWMRFKSKFIAYVSNGTYKPL